MARVTISVDEEQLYRLMRLAEVAGSYGSVAFVTDRSSGLMDNWKWWADGNATKDADRLDINLLELMDAIYDGMGTEDRVRMFHGRWFAALRRWMGLD